MRALGYEGREQHIGIRPLWGAPCIREQGRAWYVRFPALLTGKGIALQDVAWGCALLWRREPVHTLLLARRLLGVLLEQLQQSLSASSRELPRGQPSA